jgi:hypothetical protein
MAVMMPRGRWTDERLDDLAARVDRGFVETKSEIRDLRGEINGRFDSTNERLDSTNERLDSMQGTMIIGFVTLFASIVASVIGGVLAVLALG